MLWGGRFKSKLDEDAMKFSSSLNIDIRLFDEDIAVSKAHAAMLHKSGLLSDEDCDKIITGLVQISNEFKDGKWNPSENDFEDIHSAIEHRLKEITNGSADRLHAGRSRNDQVAADTCLWIKRSCGELTGIIKELQKALIEQAEDNIHTLIPGYTHLQRAQVVTLAFHLLAYVEMLERDKKRIAFVIDQADASPLGSGALAGSTLPLDNKFSAKLLGFNSIYPNAMDAVSNRDYLIDFLNTSTLCSIHLSRLAEEIVLWSSYEWRFIKLADDLMTGSSLMPQKKNPDIAELIRGRTGRMIGNYVSLASTLKALPLSYFRDLQEDKRIAFDAFDNLAANLVMMTKLIKSAAVDKNRFTEEMKNNFLWATDLADWLVLKGMAFRDAHNTVGRLVLFIEENKIVPEQIKLSDLKSISDKFSESALECFNIQNSIHKKQTHGSPNPEFVSNEIKRWKTKLFE